MKYKILPRQFFIRETNVVAQDMLGKFLIRQTGNTTIIGRITEVESYRGEDDLACHASKGRTPRCEVMFGQAGHAYVYLIYGMYNCLNVVTESVDFPAAILIRSVEPVTGIPFMEARRKSDKLTNLTTGPGKLTQAFDITRDLNGEDMTTSEQLFIAENGIPALAKDVVSTTRVGVEYAGKDALLHWRYYLKNSQFISRL